MKMNSSCHFYWLSSKRHLEFRGRGSKSQEWGKRNRKVIYTKERNKHYSQTGCRDLLLEKKHHVGKLYATIRYMQGKLLKATILITES